MGSIQPCKKKIQTQDTLSTNFSIRVRVTDIQKEREKERETAGERERRNRNLFGDKAHRPKQG